MDWNTILTLAIPYLPSFGIGILMLAVLETIKRTVCWLFTPAPAVPPSSETQRLLALMSDSGKWTYEPAQHRITHKDSGMCTTFEVGRRQYLSVAVKVGGTYQELKIFNGVDKERIRYRASQIARECVKLDEALKNKSALDVFYSIGS